MSAEPTEAKDAAKDAQRELRRGSARWVQRRLAALPEDESWTRHPACIELFDWLDTVVGKRASGLHEPWHARADIAQDAMSGLFRAVRDVRAKLIVHPNPAAALERIAQRAIEEALRVHRMAGLGGIVTNGRANGRAWAAAYPQRVAVSDMDTLVPAASLIDELDERGERAVAYLGRWAGDVLDIRLTPVALAGTEYVLDRLRDGLSRATLTHGGHSGLARDPAMQYLGLDPAAAYGLAVWLLGRRQARTRAPGVLDAVFLDYQPDELARARWRRQAVRFGLAAPAPRVTPPTPGGKLVHLDTLRAGRRDRPGEHDAAA